MNRGTFIALEGPMGAGKTTQEKMLSGNLRHQGFRVFSTAEPSKNNPDTGEEANCFGLFVHKLIEGKLTREDQLNMARSLKNLSERMFDDHGEKMGKWIKALRLISANLVNGERLTELQVQLIFLLDREMHSALIRKKVLEGYIVVCDRYEMSTFVHFMSETGYKTDILANWQYPLMGKIYLRPDYCFLFDAPARVIWRRQMTSGKVLDKYESSFRQVKSKVDFYRRAGKFFRNVPPSDPRYKYPIIPIDANQREEKIMQDILKLLPL